MTAPNYARALVAFTDEEVRSIRLEYREGAKGYQIAKARGVTKQCIYGILKGKTYRWVEA